MLDFVSFSIYEGEMQFKIPKDICGDIKQEEYLGGGSTGEVISIKNPSGNNIPYYAVKIIDTSNAFFCEEKFQREVSMLKVADTLGIGPKFINTFRYDINNVKYEFIVMEKLDQTIGEYLEYLYSCKEDVKEKRYSLLCALSKLQFGCYSYQFYHGDLYYEKIDQLNAGNIMLKVNASNEVICAKLIDFEYSHICETEFEKIKEEWEGLMQCIF